MTDTRVADPLIGGLVDGRYRVRDRLARGGMATVYLASDERLDRTVALKIVHSGQGASIQGFVDEARAIARLAHPNVVAAYDQGTHNGLPYLVMEYVPGRTLRDILAARRRLTPVEALAITEQVLAAVAAAHRAGLVHRDIKPENVLVAEAPSGGVTNLVDSVVKVTDFGLAQAVAAAAPEGDRSLLATAAYVPPELVASGRADARSDVYSVGIVLFELLTGRVPFDDRDGSGPAEVAWQHVRQEVPAPSTLVSGLPPMLDELVQRATQRDPATRPTDAGALLVEVQAVREKVTTSAVRRTRRAAPQRPADQTVVLPAVPGTERPAWARLPSRARNGTRTATRSGTRGPVDPGPQPAPDRQTEPWLQRRSAMVAMACAAVVTLLLVGSGVWFGLLRWQPAPDLVNLAGAEAETAAQQEGLQVTYADPVYDEAVPVDHVVAQDPAPDGRVRRGGTVTLTLSLGPERHPVPDIIGVDVAVAKRQLESLGLVVVEGEPGYSNSVPAGRVMAVDPAVGEVLSPGDPVTVTVSQGRPPIDIPFVIGEQLSEATRVLEQEGLSVTSEEVDSNQPAGEVVGQSPEGGAGAEPGDTVHLEVSRGPPTRPVPDVTNRRCNRAIDILEDAGFEVVLGFNDSGRVLLQNPSGGTGLPPGAEVTIWCG